MLETTRFLNGFKWNNLLSDTVLSLETGTEKYVFDLDKYSDHQDGDATIGLVDVVFEKDYEKGRIKVSGGFSLEVSDDYESEDEDEDDIVPVDLYQDEASWFVKDLFEFLSTHYENKVVELEASTEILISGVLTKKL